MNRTVKIRGAGRSPGPIFRKELLEEMQLEEGDELLITPAGSRFQE